MNNNCSNAIKHQTRYNQASLCQLIHLPLQIRHLATQVLSFVVQCKKTNKIKQLSINLTDIKKQTLFWFKSITMFQTKITIQCVKIASTNSFSWTLNKIKMPLFSH